MFFNGNAFSTLPNYSKIQNYSPTEAAKVYDKPIQRKTLVKFNPECVLNVLNSKAEVEQLDWKEERLKLVDDFLSVSTTAV